MIRGLASIHALFVDAVTLVEQNRYRVIEPAEIVRQI
jgi:hypothetical protein